MKYETTIKDFFNILFLLLFNLYGIKLRKSDIVPNDWTGEYIKIASLGDSYKKQHRLIKFSKYNSKNISHITNSKIKV